MAHQRTELYRTVGLELPRRLLRWAPILVLMAAGCTELGELPERGGGTGNAIQCVPELPYHEKKKRCDNQFKLCLDSHIQRIWSDRFGHSQCWPCKDVCMQSNGNWPDTFDGKPCR